jgi:hypothetical protein
MTPIVGFAPDADLMTPGIFTDCTNVIPYEAGFKGAPTPVADCCRCSGFGLPRCCGCDAVGWLSPHLRGNADEALRTRQRTSWTDRSAGSYTGSSESRWSFCQFGDTRPLLRNLTDAMQSSASGAFSAIAGAPKAKIVVSASNNFVMAFNTNDGNLWGSLRIDGGAVLKAIKRLGRLLFLRLLTTGRLVAIEGAIQAAADAR